MIKTANETTETGCQPKLQKLPKEVQDFWAKRQKKTCSFSINYLDIWYSSFFFPIDYVLFNCVSLYYIEDIFSYKKRLIVTSLL